MVSCKHIMVRKNAKTKYVAILFILLTCAKQFFIKLTKSKKETTIV